MDNQIGYLFRIGLRRPRPRRAPPEPTDRTTEGAHRDLDVVAALSQLSKRQRVACYLVHGLGWTLQEVAQTMDVTVASVRVHADRGLARLEELLSEGAADEQFR